MRKNKYLIPEREDGKDEICIASEQVLKDLNERYKGKFITNPCIVLGRSSVIYALIWKHQCGEYVMYSVVLLRHETAQRVINILQHGKNAIKEVKKMIVNYGASKTNRKGG
jgi:hypothetical protein